MVYLEMKFRQGQSKDACEYVPDRLAYTFLYLDADFANEVTDRWLELHDTVVAPAHDVLAFRIPAIGILCKDRRKHDNLVYFTYIILRSFKETLNDVFNLDRNLNTILHLFFVWKSQ